MKRRTLALGLLTGLAGCSILPERPPLKLYTLLANLNTQDCRAPKRRLSSVRINSPMIASLYDSTRCYVLIKDNRIYNTDINRFSSNPGNLIGDGLREVIQDCGPWNVVLSPNSISTPAYQLTVFVSKFFINAVKKPFAAVVEMEVSVVASVSGKLVFHETYSQTQNTPTDDMPGAVSAFDVCLENIFKTLTNDLNKQATRM